MYIFMFIRRRNGIYCVQRNKCPKSKIFTAVIIVGWSESGKTILQVSIADAYRWSKKYEGRSKSFATQYDAQMTQAKFLCYYST